MRGSTVPPAQTASAAPPPRPSAPVGGIAVPLLLDVTPLSLGVETAGGLCETVIRRNATIPVEQTRIFATTNDDQTTVVIRIAQGESQKFSENQGLGELELTGLRAAPRGEVSRRGHLRTRRRRDAQRPSPRRRDQPRADDARVAAHDPHRDRAGGDGRSSAPSLPTSWLSAQMTQRTPLRAC